MEKPFNFDDSVMVLIDHQVGTIQLARNIDHQTIMDNAKALLRTALAIGMPIVLTTSNETQFQGMLFDFFEELAPEAYDRRIKRPGIVNAWHYEPFKKAVVNTNKPNIVMAGLTNDVCTVFPSISAVADGYNVQVVVDAGGSPSKLADDTALRRMENEGVVLTSTNQVMAELAQDWSTQNGGKVLNIMYEEVLSKLIEQ